jgi:regulation of enolase protein 1 (concanavalin A-like superfamily)
METAESNMNIRKIAGKLKRQAFKAASLVVAGATLVLAQGAKAANNPVILPSSAATNITDINPMRMPSVGDYGLRIITPTLLELTLINTAPSGSTTPTNWNFVSGGSFTAPATSKFTVTANNSSVGVSSVGFKRRPLYAPKDKFDLRIQNSLYLSLSTAIPDGATVTVTNPDGSLWKAPVTFTATKDPLRFSPAIHVNTEGYMPNNAKKGMVGYYLGNLGELQVGAGTAYNIVDAATGNKVYSGTLTSRKDTGLSYSAYQAVLEADFSSFNTPGEYRLQVPGLGASYAFLIDDGISSLFARTYALGLYHARCGGANTYPYTRFVKDACHVAKASIPDMTYAAVNQELASMSSDYASSQAAGTPQLKDVNSSLYPFVNKNPIYVSGGHHDAGDYSKYTINIAQLLHSLTFAVDAFPGVKDLDNMGLPESGDGKSDVLQEAKWEADFLAKLQDTDGGFYFLVYPKNRQYEDDQSLVSPDLGDAQIVFPKTTAVTAAAVGALAEAGSSPTMKAQFPTEAANYLAKAKLGWQFLQNAINKYGRDGSYQKITHYGNQFGHNDELAWAAAALYAATGDKTYQTDLIAHFDPASPNTVLWGWWRCFEAYGCAMRTYAFAARSGRLQQSQLDPTFLAKCEAQLVACGDDNVNWANHNAYNQAFPDANKPYDTAGWYFSVNMGFDCAVAYQITNKQAYIDCIIGDMNYEAGCNPLNMGFVNGIGAKRQRETVNQYADLDRRQLPPTGIPQGAVQTGFTTLTVYGTTLGPLNYPSDTGNGRYPIYDRWGDTFNTLTEFVNPQAGHGYGAVAFLMARSNYKSQPWKSVNATITGLPATVPAQQAITATLSAPGIDLSKATIVWEARDQNPTPGATFNFAAVNPGAQWVEAEAALPDGRRVFAQANFNATTAVNAPANGDLSTAYSPSGDMAALYHMDTDLSDTTGKSPTLTKTGTVTLDPSNVSWMSSSARTGAALHTTDIGNNAVASIPANLLYSSDTTAITVEAMVYVNGFKGYNRGNVEIMALQKNWNASLELYENMYFGAKFRAGQTFETDAAASMTLQKWHHLVMTIDKNTGYTVKVDGATVYTKASTDFANFANTSGTATLTLGNFDGWIDEVVVRNVRPGSTTNTSAVVTLTSPINGAVYAGSNNNVTMTANPTGTSVSNVSFYQGSTLLGTDTAAPYTFTWTNAPLGTYSLTARATSGGTTVTSTPVSITITNDLTSTNVGGTNGGVITGPGGTNTGSTNVVGGIGDTNTGSTNVVGGVTDTNSTGTVSNIVATPLPSPWTNSDIGTVQVAGESVATNSAFEVSGSGADIWGTSDAFQYAYQPVTGNADVIARVVSVSPTDPWAKSGVMIRETLDAGSAHAMTVVSSGAGAAFQRRASSGAYTVHTSGPNVKAPYWVRLTRTNSTFNSYVSADGNSWTLVGTQTMTMGNSAFVGLCSTAHTTTNGVNNAVLDSITVNGAAPDTNSTSTNSDGGTTNSVPTNTVGNLVAPWVSKDVGPVGSAGTGTLSNGTFVVTGSGADIWGTSDAFQFVYQPWTGDGEIVAKVNSVEKTDPWAKAGVMFRSDLTATSAHAMTVISAGAGAAFQRRTVTGGGSTHTGGPYVTAPYWVRMVRAGNVFTSYVSTDGSTWTQVGSDTITMGNTCYVGLVACAHNNSASSAATMSNVRTATATTATGLPSPWAQSDIGSVGKAGSGTAADGTFTITGSGADIYATADAFHYVYQKWTGNGSIIAKVNSVQNTDPWAKAGVMFRETLNANSKHAMMVVSAGAGAAFQRRQGTGAYSVSTAGGNYTSPYWVKISRNGNTFSAYISSNGTSWTLVGTDSISMASGIYVGIPMTSHNNSTSGTASVSNVTVSSSL